MTKIDEALDEALSMDGLALCDNSLWLHEDAREEVKQAILTALEAQGLVIEQGWQPIDKFSPDEGIFMVGNYNHKGEWCPDIWCADFLKEHRSNLAADAYKNSPHLNQNPTHYKPIDQPPARGEG